MDYFNQPKDGQAGMSGTVKDQAAFIYAIMCGDYARSELTPEAAWIEDLYAKGAPVERMYREMMDAYDRLAERLHPGEDQDEDVEVFFSSALGMCEHIGILMYQYGAYYAQHPEAFPARKKV